MTVSNIEDLFNGYANNVKTITIGEGLETIGDYGLAGTPSLTKVSLPSTLISLGDRIFSQSNGQDRKTLHIVYAGTMSEWEAITKPDTWDKALAEGTLLQCSDGYQTVKKRTGNDSTWNDWKLGPPPANVIPNQ